MEREGEIVRRATSIFGPRLRGVFAFGSRIAAEGRPRPDSDLDVGVWLNGPVRRGNSWLPWIQEFADSDTALDPTFLTQESLEQPTSWLLEAVHGGVSVWFDPTGLLAERFREVREAIERGTYQRRLFMGLPYFTRTTP